MTTSTLRAALAALSIGFCLAACGGGGGGSSSPIPPTGPVTTTPKATLRGGFAHSSGTASTSRSTKGLASALVPIADFTIADPNVGYQPLVLYSMEAVAYYDPAGPVPNPMPTGVTWTVSGAAGGTLANAQNGQNLLGQATSIGDVAVSPSKTTGAGLLTATASNGDTVGLAFYTYAGNALDAESSYTAAASGNPNANTQPCLTFSATSAPVPGTTGDLCLTIHADKTTSLTAPGGLMIVQKTIDQVNANDLVAFNGSQTSIPSTAFAPPVLSGTFTIVAKMATGGFVKLMPYVVNSQGDSQVAGGQPVYAFGPYRVGSIAGWDI